MERKVQKASAWEISKVKNNQSVGIEYHNNHNRATVISGKNKIGDPTIQSLHSGIDYPNVFQALSNIETMSIPVNGIIMTVENYDPSGVPGTERLTITLPHHQVQDKGVINLFGQNIQFEIGEVLTTVTSKIQSALALLVERNIGISRIHRPHGSQNQLDITYIDTLIHENIDIEDPVIGIQIRGETIIEPQQGYGTWDKIGNNNTLVPNVEISIWRRIQ